MPIHVCPPYYSSLMWSCRTPHPSCLLSTGHLAATQPHDALSPWQQHHGAGRGGQTFRAPQAYHSLPPWEPHGGHQGLLPVRPLQGPPAQDPGLYWGEYGRHGHSHHLEHRDSTKDQVLEEEEAKRHLTCAMHCVSMLYHPPSNMPTFSYAAVIRSYIHECVHCETQYPDKCSAFL